MFYYISGKLAKLDGSFAVVDAGGVGFKMTISKSTYYRLSGNNEAPTVKLYTYMAVREDAMELYGFCTEEELKRFKMLISISGVGPKAAVSVLSVLSPDAFISAVAAEDSKAISRAPGVGAKTAARIVLELRDKIAKNFYSSSSSAKGEVAPSAGKIGISAGSNLSDAGDALAVLGYSRSEALSALAGLDASLPTEELIRLALAKLMKG